MNNVILKKITTLLLPFIVLYGFYILVHGEVSPGGGFQGGSIWATAFALYVMIFSPEAALRVFPIRKLKITACLGALIFAFFGFLPLLMGGRFLEYNAIYSDNHSAQSMGIMGIEIGVQLTVFAVLSLIFMKLVLAKKD